MTNNPRRTAQAYFKQNEMFLRNCSLAFIVFMILHCFPIISLNPFNHNRNGVTERPFTWQTSERFVCGSEVVSHHTPFQLNLVEGQERNVQPCVSLKAVGLTSDPDREQYACSPWISLRVLYQNGIWSGEIFKYTELSHLKQIYRPIQFHLNFNSCLTSSGHSEKWLSKKKTNPWSSLGYRAGVLN